MSSFMMMVVLMHMNMLHSYALCQGERQRSPAAPWRRTVERLVLPIILFFQLAGR